LSNKILYSLCAEEIWTYFLAISSLSSWTLWSSSPPPNFVIRLALIWIFSSLISLSSCLFLLFSSSNSA
jgi:hypothetical protein